MKPLIINRFAAASLLVVTSLSAWAEPSQVNELRKLPKYQTPMPYPGARNFHHTHNFGPTGARFWVEGSGGHSRNSREALIKSIEPGSPADGILLVYDVVVGAAVPPDTPSTQWQTAPELRPFESDARLSLARAITWAESTRGQGKLRLMVQRDGQLKPVTIPIPVLGDYAATAPYDCPKTARIVSQAAAFLAKHMPVEGYSQGVPEPKAAALLLASGDARYLDHVRRPSALYGSQLQRKERHGSGGFQHAWRHASRAVVCPLGLQHHLRLF